MSVCFYALIILTVFVFFAELVYFIALLKSYSSFTISRKSVREGFACAALLRISIYK